MTSNRPAPRPLTGDWSSRTSHDEREFTLLAGEWDDLVTRCRSATPFQTSGWLLSWWRHYGPPKGLRVITVRRDGLLVAAAAMFVERRGVTTVLAPVGRGPSDMTDVLVDDDHVEQASARLAAAILALPDWHVADLPEVRPDAAALYLVKAWPRSRWEVDSSVCLELPGAPIEDLLSTTTRANRKSLRRRLRSVADAGVDSRSVDPAAVDDAVAALFDLHERQWRGRGGESEHLTPRFRSMVTDAVAALGTRGWARLEEHRIGGELVASEMLLVGPGAVYSYFLGIAPALRDRLDAAALTIGHDLAVARHVDRPVLSLLRGDEEYKRRWSTASVTHRRLLLARRPGLRPAAFALGVRGRAGARSWLVDRQPALHQALGEARRRLSSEGVTAAVRVALPAAADVVTGPVRRRLSDRGPGG